MKKVLMPFADGFEMVEALTVVDILRRGGVEITMCSITDKLLITSVHNVNVEMDCKLSEVDINDFDGIILPGGAPGTVNLANSSLVCDCVTKLYKDKKLVAAICAAPIVLGKCGILADKQATCYPNFEKDLKAKELIRDKMVVVDKNVVTSRGMATSMEFGFTLLSMLTDNETSQKIRKSVIFMY